MESVKPFSFEVTGTALTCQTRVDLFSPKALDKGSELLMQQVAEIEYAEALDWGCGWGAIGLWLAKRRPEAQVTLIDSDLSAIKAADANAELNTVTNAQILLSAGYEEVSQDTRFDLIVSNPPTHRGREVVESMIQGSHARLKSNGHLVIVVEARLKPWVQRCFHEVFGQNKVLARTSKHVVIGSHR